MGGILNVGLIQLGINTISVAGSSDVTATTGAGGQAENTIQTLTGALTGDINYILPPDAGKVWVISNTTSGAHNITVKTPLGTGIVVGQGKHAILYSDGTNIERVTADV